MPSPRHTTMYQRVNQSKMASTVKRLFTSCPSRSWLSERSSSSSHRSPLALSLLLIEFILNNSGIFFLCLFSKSRYGSHSGSSKTVAVEGAPFESTHSKSSEGLLVPTAVGLTKSTRICEHTAFQSERATTKEADTTTGNRVTGKTKYQMQLQTILRLEPI